MMVSLFSRNTAKRFLLLNPNNSPLLRLLKPPNVVSPSSTTTVTRQHSFSPATQRYQRLLFPSMFRSYCSTPQSSQFLEKPTIQNPDHAHTASSESEEAGKVVVSLRKTTSDLRWSFVALGAAQFGNWIQNSGSANSSEGSLEMVMRLAPGVVTFAFPCALAFLTWKLVRNLKVVEGNSSAQGKVRPLAVISSASSQIESLLFRARLVTLLCVVGVCLPPFISNMMK